jgi:hypothetical protein
MVGTLALGTVSGLNAARRIVLTRANRPSPLKLIREESSVRCDEKAWLIGYFVIYPSKSVIPIQVKLELFSEYSRMVAAAAALDEASQDQSSARNAAQARAFALSNPGPLAQMVLN